MLFADKVDVINKKIAQKVIRSVIPFTFIFASLFTLAVFVFSPDQPTRLFPAVIILIIICTVYFLDKTGKSWLSVNLLLFSSILIALISMIINGGIEAPIFSALIPIAAVLGWVYTLRTATYIISASLVITAIILVLSLLDYLPKVKNPDPFVVWVTMSGYVFLAIVLSNIPSKMLRKSLAESEDSKKRILEAKLKAEKADKLKTDFLAQISHEIRTPLSTIMSYSQLIENETNSVVDPNLFAGIQNSGNRIIRTVDMLLNVSQIQTNTYESNPRLIKVREEVLEKLVAEFKYPAELKGLELILLVEEEFIIKADEYSVIQIFANLIDNAIKYTQKGRVVISALKTQEESVTISIEDTGIGISDDFLPELFKPFSQETTGYTRKYEGNGLGMALVKEYCNINHAIISVESQKNIGTTFKVTFNLVPESVNALVQ